jgi:signal transduction histidine kinase/ActR/RegA family two-component response regulator
VPANDSSASERVLVLMPTLKDSERTSQLLTEASVASAICNNLTELCRELRRDAGAVLLTEDSLLGDSSGQLAEALRVQPAWSALPLLVISRDAGSRDIQRLGSDVFNNLIIIERPVRTHSLVSLVQSALRARRHQYQIRDVLAVREQQEAALARQAEDLRLADRRKDEFLATLAHELRNPLAPIRTGMDLLTHSPNPETSARTLGVMQRQVGHMVRLIDDLLDVSRITRGKLELKRERVTLTAIIAAAVEASRPLIERNQHTLRINVHDTSICFDADVTRIGQVISNLLNNSANYTPSGGLIELSVERAGNQALIQVKDNGSGIPRDHLHGVFEMFSQVNRALDRSQGGLGIGLALVRSLVEMHGGSVEADSPGPGLGSTFTVRLPIAEGAAAAAGEEQNRASAPRDVATRVLIVDDNQDAADMLALMLSNSGYVTTAANDGEAALAATESWQPHVVVLDIGLPGMSGYDIARELRRRQGPRPLWLIALTGWGSHADKQQARDAGFDVHLTKPVDTRTLHDAITQRRRRSEGAGYLPA